jgi:hypothetical protein
MVHLAVGRTRVESALGPSQVSRDVLLGCNTHNSKLAEQVPSTPAVGSAEAGGHSNKVNSRARVTLKAEIKVNSTRTNQGTKVDIGNDCDYQSSHSFICSFSRQVLGHSISL